jgi:NADPH:quinone reductase-like Zn-dependent oxidoreductase
MHGMLLPCSFEEASSMPTVFITVDTALHRIACVSSCSRVLVHAAAGGVGLAAMQVIAAAGAAAVATAGSPAKRALLRTLGATQVVGSRDTLFVGELALQVRRFPTWLSRTAGSAALHRLTQRVATTLPCAGRR